MRTAKKVHSQMDDWERRSMGGPSGLYKTKGFLQKATIFLKDIIYCTVMDTSPSSYLKTHEFSDCGSMKGKFDDYLLISYMVHK